MIGVPRTAVRFLAKRVVDPLLYRLDSRYVFYRARRDWNVRAREMPRETTATFDAGDWDTYWTSGRRDLDLCMELAQEAGQFRRDLAIEIGCGLGRITRPLADHFNQVVGVDIAEEMLRQARAFANASNITYAPVPVDHHLPVGDGVADLVIAWTVFRHMDKSIFAAYLDEARRALKPGRSLVFDAQVRPGGGAEPPPFESLTEREFTRTELSSYCRDHGFAWGAERTTHSATPGTLTLILAWVKRAPC